jgi:hypothetical protein
MKELFARIVLLGLGGALIGVGVSVGSVTSIIPMFFGPMFFGLFLIVIGFQK